MAFPQDHQGLEQLLYPTNQDPFHFQPPETSESDSPRPSLGVRLFYCCKSLLLTTRPIVPPPLPPPPPPRDRMVNILIMVRKKIITN